MLYLTILIFNNRNTHSLEHLGSKFQFFITTEFQCFINILNIILN